MVKSHPARVLVVDDEQGMRDMLVVLLKRAGFHVTARSSGRRAITALKECEYDLVVTDLVMPGVDGMEVLSAAKHRSLSTQVIVITAHATSASAVDAMRRGSYDYILKPFKVEEIQR